MTHDYKTQHNIIVNGTCTCWDSVKSKYADILELMRKELPSSEEEASLIFNKINQSIKGYQGDNIDKSESY